MRRDFYQRILLLAVTIVHLLAGFPVSHAAAPPDIASHLERAAQADQMPCHDQAPEEAPMTDDCSGHCFCCCALSAPGLISLPYIPSTPPADSYAVGAEPALIEFYPPVEPHPPNSFRHRA